MNPVMSAKAGVAAIALRLAASVNARAVFMHPPDAIIVRIPTRPGGARRASTIRAIP
jgi:hypothetical protein